MPRENRLNLAQRSMHSLRAAANRRAETQEQRERRLESQRIRNATKRASESFGEHEHRLKQQRVYEASRRLNETEEQYERRLQQQRAYETAKRATETPEQYRQRLERQRIREAIRRSRETPEQRERRIKHQRAYETARRVARNPEERRRLQDLILLFPHLNQGNLRKRKNSLQNHTATATVSSEGNAFLQPIVPQHHEKRFQQNQFEKRQMFAAQSAQVAVPPASRRVQALAPPTQVAAPPLQVPSQMQLQQQQQPVPVLYRTPTLAAPRNTQVFNAPRNTQVFDAPRNTQVFDAPRNTHVFDAPRNTQVFDAPRNTQVFEAPRNTQVFEAPRNTQVFEAPRNTQVFEAPRNTQVFEAPIPVDVAKPEPVQKPRPRQKPRFVVRDHHLSVMSNLSALWQKRKLCDAGIGNGTSTVMVHKVVLSAVCPKLLSVFSTDILSQKFLQVNFPEEVSTEALNAFAEYMYNGILDLDVEILKQLKIIAKRLDMKEFEELCDRHLPYVFHQSAVGPFTNLPLIETSVFFPAMTSSHASLDSSISMNGAPSVMTQVIDINHEISEAELDQVKKDTAALFGQESDVTSLALNRSGNTAGFVIYPSIKTEPVGPEDNKYGYLSNNQVFTPTISPSSSSLATAATPSYTSIPSISTSSIEFSIPSSQSTDVKSTRLKPTHSYKIPLVSDLCPISRIDETVYSKSSAIKENSSLQLSRQPISTSSIQLPSTSTNNEGIYPLGLFTVKRDNPALLTTETFNVKTDLT